MGAFAFTVLVYVLAWTRVPGDVMRVLFAIAVVELVAIVVALVRWCVLDVRSHKRSLAL